MVSALTQCLHQLGFLFLFKGWGITNLVWVARLMDTNSQLLKIFTTFAHTEVHLSRQGTSPQSKGKTGGLKVMIFCCALKLFSTYGSHFSAGSSYHFLSDNSTMQNKTKTRDVLQAADSGAAAAFLLGTLRHTEGEEQEVLCSAIMNQTITAPGEMSCSMQGKQ